MVKEMICVGKGKRKKCDYHYGKIVYNDNMVKIMRFDVWNKPHIIVRDKKTRTRFSIYNGKANKIVY